MMHPRYGAYRFLDFIPFWLMGLCCILILLFLDF